MRCDLKEPGAGTQALGGEGNHTESWYRNWSWCISALPLQERGTLSCIQSLDGAPAHWKCHHSSTADLHEIREQLRPDCRGREAQLINAYIRGFFSLSMCICGVKWAHLKIFKLKRKEHLSITRFSVIVSKMAELYIQNLTKNNQVTVLCVVQTKQKPQQ